MCVCVSVRVCVWVFVFIWGVPSVNFNRVDLTVLLEIGRHLLDSSDIAIVLASPCTL